MVYHNLKALIKGIRACKTVADERALIQQESAAIRASFREEDSFARHNNIAKLLYIHMLGSPAHFGQIECLKLVASPRFSDKRLGYLGIMLLLDENQETLMLVTNSLKNDMNHSNMYAVGLALCTFANIASEEMSRDLVNEIEKLLGSSNAYIRKKSALCALRVIKKVPELTDHFVEKSKNLLTDRNHGVLLTAITLITEMCQISPSVLDAFRNAVPLLVRNLKSLVTTGYSPEHDVSGITDPFLQVKILRLLRMLGRGDERASETMNDILAQVATNTDSTKNVGNSILYETVLTVLEIEADTGLRVMAINILGKFLGNRDNNIRYVALNTLNKVVSMDTSAVQRHRNIILDCLRDGDISIRRRALELSYALINEQNVRVLIRELLAFLEVADDEFKLGMTTQISLAAEKFAPNKRWHIDTVLRVLKLAGNFVREEILSAFIRLVAHTPELQAYTASKLYTALQADISQESLTLAATWVIGEYSDILLEGGLVDEDHPKQISDKDVVDLILSTLDSPYSNYLIRQFALASLTKISARHTASQLQQDRVAELLAKYTASPELELQQRAVEFASLFTLGPIREGVLERMPPPELKATVMGVVSENKPVGSTKVGKDVDLLGDDTLTTSGPAANGQAAAAAQNNQDLLAEIFGSSSTSSAPMTSTPTPASSKSTVDDILGLFGSTPAPSAPAPAPAASLFSQTTAASPPLSNISQATPISVPPQPPAPRLTAYTAYDKNELQITLTPQTSAAKPGMVMILAKFQVSGSNVVTNMNFQAAVPKSQQLQMLPMSNTTINPGVLETQQMRVIAPVGSNIRLRLRVSFTIAGQAVQDQIDFSGFPPGLTSGT
ncbi:clathrin associated protein complex large subunit [Pleurotus ostreatus]|uniref:AP-1 complex subunit gamma n=1 Tax=Pleurotus ostreatus TaxID=5322 RepID=A0A8H6ZY03_PLEOS|nr:clathrin associated protein complex large subunit [Pleurotus ostreatus]KAF7430752.1 clathrin associated protein complex large subunit [Pleurotus ostreatus]KAJ8695098.1 clathrin associated protein complex large subunit [Pleurotus ostreatus]